MKYEVQCRTSATTSLVGVDYEVVKDHEDMKDPGNTFCNYVSTFLVTTNIMTTYIIMVQRICIFYGPIKVKL